VAKKAGRHSRSITPHPGEIRERLECLARNLHWSWDAQTAMLFESLDPALWRAVDRNPLRVIRSVDAARWAVLADDRGFRDRLAACEGSLRDYLRTKPWFARSASRREKKLHVAYFCAEYAVHECMQIYAGGLGVLAGDHLKSASDLGIPLTAIGLLYRHGYYRQQLQSDGSTRVVYPTYDYADWPIEDTGLEIEIPLMRRTIRARIWKMMVGRVELYLLDTDLADNKPEDREITRFLYGGDSEYRVQQEVVLGIGGRIALDALGIEPTVYHLNEGHAAFCALERVRRFMLEGAGIDDAMQAVRQSSVFTTHTPVPAGNDRFEPTLTWKYLGPMAREMGLSRRQLLTLGREDPTDLTEPFCMTVLALKLSEHCNGVAELHGDTSRRMWMKTYDADSPADVPIRHVTNGIHVQTWLAPEASRLYDRYLKPKWNGAGPDDDWWAKVDRIPPAELWAMRNMLRARMITFIRGRLARQIARRGGPIEDLIAAHETFSDEALTIGFARRFATYKRAPLIFRDVASARLDRGRSRPTRPVRVRGQGPPAGSRGQGIHPADLPARPPRRIPRPRRDHRGLRHADRAHAHVRLRRLAEQPGAADGSVRHERHEAAAAWRDQLLDPRRLVARGLQPPQRLGHRGRSRAQFAGTAGRLRRRVHLRSAGAGDRAHVLQAQPQRRPHAVGEAHGGIDENHPRPVQHAPHARRLPRRLLSPGSQQRVTTPRPQAPTPCRFKSPSSARSANDSVTTDCSARRRRSSTT
jgi:starch phosphorylase